MKECQLCKQCYPDTVTTCLNDGMPTFHSISGEPVLEGKYKLDKRLGQGGMGVVYCARHAYLKTQHAIKVILPDLVGNDPQLVTRFRQEALAAAAIRHHNVIAVTDFGVAQGTMPFLVMEFVEGESLHDLLARESRLSPEKAAELMSAICAGVGAAHRQGIVHRDLKPLNIMIQKDRQTLAEAVKILDFGLAKIKSGELLGSFIQAQTTGLMGSPYYMAPEQWADEDPDGSADIYSLGIMLFQMIAGDVPFKGSSIPAIMQKHLNTQPPSFAEFGVQVPPQVELAVRHTLEKDRHKRTQTTEELVEELRSAVNVSSQSSSIHTSQTTKSAPVSTLHILTKPPQAKVFVDSVSIGQSQSDGWLLLEGLQSGNHRLRISHEGFQDWESDVVCDGKPQQVVAELKNFTNAIPPPLETMNFSQPVAPNYNATQGAQNVIQQTFPLVPQNSIHQNTQQNWQSSPQNTAVQTASKKSAFSPLMMAITGILGILLLTAIGIGAAFMFGLIGKSSVAGSNANSVVNLPSNSNANVQTPPLTVVKNELVPVPGGRFIMGRNDGDALEKPEHEVEVKDFLMDKTEVTNAEFYAFVKEKGYSPIPANWENGKPLPNEEMMPVRYVNLEDIEAFIEWRSARDGVTYRLPTEEEWEYAARNGSENNLYPWGDKWEEGRAVVNRDFVFEPVGSKTNGANKWGILGLIGNVWEWTSSEAKSYPGAEKQLEIRGNSTFLVVRGAFSPSKETLSASSTFRGFVPSKKRDKVVGFRLVRSDK
jgi:serine/threonine protein kinase/formylglycine-generating enzyme required for sulfatase activity